MFKKPKNLPKFNINSVVKGKCKITKSGKVILNRVANMIPLYVCTLLKSIQATKKITKDDLEYIFIIMNRDDPEFIYN